MYRYNGTEYFLGQSEIRLQYRNIYKVGGKFTLSLREDK